MNISKLGFLIDDAKNKKCPEALQDDVSPDTIYQAGYLDALLQAYLLIKKGE